MSTATLIWMIRMVRHFRGHGIHSPFVYGLKREALMKKAVPSENNQLFNALTSSGITKKIARELQNVHTYCNLSGFEIVDSNNVVKPASPEVFYIVMKGATLGRLNEMLESNEKVSVALLDKKMARKIYSGNITIERSRYILIFKDTGLPIQTFKL